MPLWFWILFAVLSVLALLSVYYFYRQAQHVASRHIHIVTAENADVVRTWRLRFLLFCYVISFVLALVFFFSSFWSQL